MCTIQHGMLRENKQEPVRTLSRSTVVVSHTRIHLILQLSDIVTYADAALGGVAGGHGC